VVFTGLENDSVWRVCVEDDPQFAPRGPPAPLILTSLDQRGEVEARARGNGKTGKRGVDDLTNELKNLDIEELRAGSERYKALLEARDLEDTLYG